MYGQQWNLFEHSNGQGEPCTTKEDINLGLKELLQHNSLHSVSTLLDGNEHEIPSRATYKQVMRAMENRKAVYGQILA